jgi:hypothetical protein
MGSSLNEVVSKCEIVTMDKSEKFEVKTNSKIKESQDDVSQNTAECVEFKAQKKIGAALSGRPLCR